MLASTTVKRTGCVERNRVQTDCSGLSVWWLCIRYILHNNNTDTVLCRKVLLQQCCAVKPNALSVQLVVSHTVYSRPQVCFFPYLSISSNVTCKYKRFQTVNVHNIIHEICNNLVTMAKNAPVDSIFLQYLKKAQFCLQKVEIKSADCEVQKKPDSKYLHHRTQKGIPLPTMMMSQTCSVYNGNKSVQFTWTDVSLLTAQDGPGWNRKRRPKTLERSYTVCLG